MTYSQSPYAGHHQFAEFHRFLLETYALYGTIRNWEPRRLEGNAFHNTLEQLQLVEQHMRHTWVIWRNAQNHIVGALCYEDDGACYPQIHPHYLTVIPLMIDYITHTPTSTPISVWCHNNDQPLMHALTNAGFAPTSDYANQKRLDLIHTDLPEPVLPPGYRLATMSTDTNTTNQLADLLNSAFHRTFHSGAEYRTFQRMAPSYRTEFDMVIYDQHNHLVANVGLTVHPHQSCVVVEPVATHPDHQRRGLARAALIAGLRRAQHLGIQTAWVAAWHSNFAANHTYNAVGFVDVSQHQRWQPSQPHIHTAPHTA